jgi:hypothetical protein
MQLMHPEFLCLNVKYLSDLCEMWVRDRVMVFNAIFQQLYFSYIMAVSFIGVGNRKYPEKTTDLPQVTDKLHPYRFPFCYQWITILPHLR